MPGAVLPPFGQPAGPELPVGELLDSFLDGSPTGFAEDLHVEDAMLLADRMFPLGIRVDSGTVLLRADIPQDLVELKEAVERHLGSRGLETLERDARLGDIVAIQISGVRGAMWDLWGRDGASAAAGLERAVTGESTVAVEPAPAEADDSGMGMTLEELLGEIEDEDRND